MFQKISHFDPNSTQVLSQCTVFIHLLNSSTYKSCKLITIMTMVMDNFATFSFAFVSLDLPFVCWFPVHRPFEAAKIIWNFDFKNWTFDEVLTYHFSKK